LVVSSWLL